MEEIFRPNHLLDYELDYELKIRSVVSQRNVSDKRKMLGTLLNKENMSRRSVIDDNIVKRLDLVIEERDIHKSLLSIADIISDFEGSAQDSTFLRMKSRLSHVSSRIQRLKIDDTDAAMKTFKDESYATCLTLESDLHEKISKNTDQPSASFNCSFQQPFVNIPAPIVNCSGNIPAIGDWQIKFNGESKHLYNFLERISELAQSRKVKDEDLFNSAAELFIGDAFIWYKSIKHTVNSWPSLVDRLKKDFFHSDNEDNLWEQIKLRKQKRNESVAVFIAHLQILFSRLLVTPAEVTKVKHIRKNLLPEYITQLALTEVNTVDDLAKHCRKLEEASYLRNKQNISELNNIDTFGQGPSSSKNSSSSYNSFENKKYHNPNLIKNDKSSYHKNENKPGSSKNPSSQNKSRLKISEHPCNTNPSYQKNDSTAKVSNDVKIICWNCELPNHLFMYCKAKRNIFCYKCGMKNVKSKDCFKCSKNL